MLAIPSTQADAPSPRGHVVRAAAAVMILGSSILVAGSAVAQMAPATMPLVMGSATPVGPVGIPLGATELALPGISPGPEMGCPQANGSTGALFDGGGMAPAPSAGCTMPPPMTGTMPTAPLTNAGGVGIPLGATELVSPGLSPLPPATTFASPLVAPMVAAPVTAMPPPLPPAMPCTSAFAGQSVPQLGMTTSSTALSLGGC
jgi:hypothetical protein